eukprot:194494-Pleurochrysis_carterae.AAC.1
MAGVGTHLIRAMRPAELLHCLQGKARRARWQVWAAARKGQCPKVTGEGSVMRYKNDAKGEGG